MKGSTSRIDILSRIAAAVVGGYALSAATAVCLALLLPMMRSEAVLTGTMVSFVVYVCVAIWVFAASSAGRAWIGLLLCAGLLGGVVLVFHFEGAP